MLPATTVYLIGSAGGRNVQVFYINNNGGGFADKVDCPDGETVGEFFNRNMRGQSAASFLIRLNRAECAVGDVMHEGDRLSITPSKIEGAR